MSKNGMNVGRGGSMEVRAPKGCEAKNGKNVHKQTGGDLRAASGAQKKADKTAKATKAQKK